MANEWRELAASSPRKTWDTWLAHWRRVCIALWQSRIRQFLSDVLIKDDAVFIDRHSKKVTHDRTPCFGLVSLGGRPHCPTTFSSGRCPRIHPRCRLGTNLSQRCENCADTVGRGLNTVRPGAPALVPRHDVGTPKAPVFLNLEVEHSKARGVFRPDHVEDLHPAIKQSELPARRQLSPHHRSEAAVRG